MENRLNLLCEAGVIDKDICSGMLQVVRRLDEEWRLPVHSEQGIMAMTHMASALMRSRQGEVVEALDGDILAEMAQSPLWPTILLVHQALLKEFTVTPHVNEEGYMLANLYGLWMAANEGV
ncbi:PRD domain-containing protein [Citrobacter freundii complex sp. 2025EL-00176]